MPLRFDEIFPYTLVLIGCSLSDQHLSPIQPKYDDWFSSDLQRFTQIVLKFKTQHTGHLHCTVDTI